MHVRLAGPEDVPEYTLQARTAQARLISRGLGQYIPAAHVEYAEAIEKRAASGTLYAVVDDGQVVGFFCLDPVPSPWWPTDGTSALYLSGIVVDSSARGRGVGEYIIGWSAAAARNRRCSFVRLDCHADNTWLCRYYERHGFVLQSRIEQHPGYYGCLYQLAVADA